MQLTLLVLAASAATSNGLAAPVANPGATTSQGGLFAAVAAKNAEMLAVKEGKKLIKDVKKLPAAPFSMMTEKGPTLAKLLEREGCVGVPEALTPETAATLRAFVEDRRDVAMAEVEEGGAPFESRFGGVNCRGKGVFGTRQDLYQPVDAPEVRAALSEFFERLRPLLEPLVGLDATLHEISSLVADPGAPRQCIHADTIVLPCPQYPSASMEPLYTCFIALQDVDDDMGHTLFLPQTHTDHTLWNVRRQDQETYISSRKAVQSNLQTGDVAIFDSRVLHCGLGNTSNKRRILFYCTVSAQHAWPLPDGLHGSNSVLPADRSRWRVRDFLSEEPHEGTSSSVGGSYPRRPGARCTTFFAERRGFADTVHVPRAQRVGPGPRAARLAEASFGLLRGRPHARGDGLFKSGAGTRL